MINLLPSEKKEELFLEQVKKMIIVLGGTIIISLICFVLVLLSIKFFVLREIILQREIFADVNTTSLSETKSVVQKYNEIFPALISFYDRKTYFSKILEEIFKIQTPAGLYLYDISLGWGPDGAVQASISGVSDTRENLLTFKKNIESNKNIKRNQFSSDSWIKEKNANFYLTLEF